MLSAVKKTVPIVENRSNMLLMKLKPWVLGPWQMLWAVIWDICELFHLNPKWAPWMFAQMTGASTRKESGCRPTPATPDKPTGKLSSMEPDDEIHRVRAEVERKQVMDRAYTNGVLPRDTPTLIKFEIDL
jgi:hypothetical protein